LLSLHHVGSTAIPRLLAKPIIDIVVEARCLEDIDKNTNAMTSCGYEARGAYGIEGRRYFKKVSADGVGFHLHVFARGSPHIGRHIRFRDYLIAAPETAQEYAALKLSLCDASGGLVPDYAERKAPFIERIDRLAMENHYGDAAGDIVYRVAEKADLPALARLRWGLKTDDRQAPEGEDFARFRDAFLRRECEDRVAGEAVHWMAVADGAPVAAMSVVVVKKLASPGGAGGRWGYLTNCYVAPAHRNSGVGGGLLNAIQRWAKAEALEFLIVWPNERADAFYRRNGFAAPDDILVWTPGS
jgi:GrpB-like predicted nucleotidyltransferase (UPF0157 family)/GNAT superfamily N-acetyltransferase